MGEPIEEVLDTSLATFVEQAATIEHEGLQIDLETFDLIKDIRETDEVVRKVGQSRGELFTVKSRRTAPRLYDVHATTLGRRWLTLVSRKRMHDVPVRFPQHAFPPSFDALAKALAMSGLERLAPEDCVMQAESAASGLVDCLNRAVDELRRATSSPSSDAERIRHTKASRKNLNSAQRWLTLVLSRHANLLVLRMDLAYEKAYEFDSGSMHAVSLQEAIKHRHRFLRKLPLWIHGDALLGYMCKSEYGLRRTLHHHLLILVDGGKLRGDIKLIQFLGHRWKAEITQGRGTFFNVNANWKDRESERGIGEVAVSDEQRVFNLRHRVIAYLAKPDYLVRWVMPKKFRMFLKSVARIEEGAKRGRPRKSSSLSEVLSETGEVSDECR